MIEIKHLSKKYSDSFILKDISAVINNGDVIAVIGPSGVGKSTFIRCLNLLVTPTGGQIIIDGKDITAEGTDVSKARCKIGMVFQHFNLFKNMTVLENVIFPQVDVLGRSRQEACDKAVENLKAVGMYDRLLKYPTSLSGGQQQRVAIARTLSMDPDIILFDEPTSALDPTLVGEVEYIIEKLAQQGRTMVIVTHEMQFARKVADRIFYLDEGIIYEEGTPEKIFTKPEREKTKRFVMGSRFTDIELSRTTTDIPEIFSKIAIFASQLDLNVNAVNRLQTIFEELCLEILLPGLKDGDRVHMMMESSEQREAVNIKICYDGEPVTEKSLDSVAGKLVKHAADEIKFLDGEIEIKVNK